MSLAQRVVRIQLPTKPLFVDLTVKAKNLYNCANYLMRQKYFASNKALSYHALWKNLKDQKNYLELQNLAGSHAPQQLLRQLRANWNSYSRAVKDWKVHPEKYFAKPKIPKYKKKNEKFNILWSNQQVRIRNGKVLVPERLHEKGFPSIPIDKLPVTEQNITIVRLVPFHDRFVLELAYKIELPNKDVASTLILGIDLGVNNLIASSDGLLIKGGVVKSINQYYNKEKAKTQQQLARQNLDSCNHLLHLQRRRYNALLDYFHKVCKQLIEHCVEKNIGAIAIGRNVNWKQNINLGRRTNQEFVFIPFYKLCAMITYKAEQRGITVQFTSEEYTSQKCSCCGHTSRKNRVYRGLFICKCCRLVINADVNAARNIAQKVLSESQEIGDSGSVVLPVKETLRIFVYK